MKDPSHFPVPISATPYRGGVGGAVGIYVGVVISAQQRIIHKKGGLAFSRVVGGEEIRGAARSRNGQKDQSPSAQAANLRYKVR